MFRFLIDNRTKYKNFALMSLVRVTINNYIFRDITALSVPHKRLTSYLVDDCHTFKNLSVEAK